MSTGTIIIIAAIAVVAILAFALLLVLPGRRAKRRNRELDRRRQRVAAQHNQEAERRSERANVAEQRARMAAAEAQHERAEAELHAARANIHERGLADHELIRQDERRRFAGTSAVPADDPRGDTNDVAVAEDGSEAHDDLARYRGARPERGAGSNAGTRSPRVARSRAALQDTTPQRESLSDGEAFEDERQSIPAEHEQP